MKVIGITGLIGSGKTEVCKIIKKFYKCPIIFSDKIAKYLYKKDINIKKKLIKKFGNIIINQNKEIDINKLKEQIIKNEKNLDELEKIIHPAIFKKEKEIIKFFKKKKKYKCIIIENAILFKVLDYKLCDIIILVRRKEKKRKKENKKNLKNLFTKRQKKIKIKKYNFIIYNNGTKKELRKKVEKIMKKII